MKVAKSDIPPIPDIEIFLASSVHDMKNSVAILISRLEKILISADKNNFPEYDGFVQMNHEAKRINDKLMQLLTLYKMGQKVYPFDPQYVSIDEFFQTIASQNMDLLASQGIKLEIQTDPKLSGYFDEVLIYGVIANALNNASRHTLSHIYLSAKKNNGVLELCVEDNGKGFPEAILQESVDAIRNVDFQSGNTGLGLYFSALVARLHRKHGCSGEIKLENGGHLGGGCFTLSLP